MFSTRSDSPDAAEDRGSSSSRIGRWTRWLTGILAVLCVAYLGYLVATYSIFYGRSLYYPEDVLKAHSKKVETPDNMTRRLAGREVTGGTTGDECAPSAIATMQAALIRQTVVENVWVPAHPLYKVGFFGLVDFENTPWFDNKASEQMGILDILRRTGIEMRDSMGRIRGSSLENPQLASAQSSLQIDENAWFVNNPFNPEQNTISPSAASSYESAIHSYEVYNNDLSRCEATFDARADNLRAVLGRFTATLGGTTAELEARSKAVVYDPDTDKLIEGEGNNYGWFDFQADNYFHRGRGKMYALVGILEAMRVDFEEVIVDRNVTPVWDRMEATVGEAAMLDPWIVSNGAADGLLAPDHLTAMAEMILRARTSMVEIRDILAR